MGSNPWGHKELDTTEQLTRSCNCYVIFLCCFCFSVFFNIKIQLFAFNRGSCFITIYSSINI